MAVFRSLLLGMTILFGICAQMLLLDVSIKNLQLTRRRIFLVGNTLVLVANMALSLVLPVDQHMKFYVLFVHIPIYFVFLIATRTSPIKVIFALFTAVFLIYPANVLLTIVSQVVKDPHPLFLIILYTAVCTAVLLVIYRFFKTNFNYLIKYYSSLSLIKLCLLPSAYYVANYWLGYITSPQSCPQAFLLRILVFIITLISYVLILDIAKTASEKEALQGKDCFINAS